MSPAELLASFWSRLRSVSTLAAGEAVLLEWESFLPDNSKWLNWRRPMLADCIRTVTGSQGVAPFVMPTNSVTGEAAAKAIGSRTVCGFVTAALLREYGVRADIEAQFAEARGYWSGRVAMFAASAAADIAEVSAGVADSVAAISDDLAILNETVSVVSSYVDMPEEARAAVDANIAGIRERRAQDIANIRAMADSLRSIEFDLREGDLTAFEPVGVVAPSLSPVVVLGGIGALLALLKGG